MNNQKGVTLIALVITIIVLIILAGVTIAMLTGDNGILKNAETARTDNDNAAIADRINLELNAFKADILVDGKLTYNTFNKTKGSLGNDYEIKAGNKVLTSDNSITDDNTLATAIGNESNITISKKESTISGSIELTKTVGEVTKPSGKITKAK